MLAGSANMKVGKRYVDDIMQTSGLTRHHNDPKCTADLDRCAMRRTRARVLIETFANSI
jgi:hypothetical protein